MKFYELIILMVLMTVWGVLISGQLKQIMTIEERVEHSFDAAQAYRFISESFRNTCEGKGFKSFDDWEDCCRALWEQKLDYIKWDCVGNSASVSDVSGVNGVSEMKTGRFMEDGDLFCGRWSYMGESGEVFARRKNKN